MTKRRLGPVTIECRMEHCGWSAQAPSWRKARRLRAAHMADKHG